jgi:hypothetical protein
MKRCFSILLILTVCCFSIFGDGQDVNNFSWQIIGEGDSRTITITAYTGKDTSIRIPEKINNIPVTAIANSFQRKVTGQRLVKAGHYEDRTYHTYKNGQHYKVTEEVWVRKVHRSSRF